MKKMNLFKKLKVNENDSRLMSVVKNGTKVIIGATLTVGAGLGALAVVGKFVNRKDEVIAFEEEMGAE
jgi:hypothetical protein